MLRIFTLAILLLNCITIFAQTWSEENQSNARELGIRKIVPEKFILAKISDQEMKDVLWKAPMESTRSRNVGTSVKFMLASGKVDEFRIVEYSMMEPSLARKFPDFKTFYGHSTSNNLRTIRLDYTVNGVRAVISDESGQTYIDPYQTNDNELRIIYRKEDISRKSDWECLADSKGISNVKPSGNRFAGDCMLREYRIAVAATGEYTAFHGGAVAAQAAIVTAINRVNEVYEQDIACSFNLVANNDLLVYTDAANDPYTNNDGFAMLSQNQSNVNLVIGSANYDIGHVFSTAGGGVATLESVCTTSTKARGVTGQPNPVNDPFWIDYVAHEIGHQFGANHTQNNNCNRNGPTAVEPGSASTIMGYAGICAPNVQSNSDPYFHAISIGEMTAHITSTSCAVESSFGNAAPVVSVVSNYTVPKSTFLVLDVVANDIDASDNLTYCWEQMDNETATMPPSSMNTGGPAFRSLNPSSDSKRYLPSIDSIVSNITPEWEVLPSVSRDMDWRVTVRDHSYSAGCTDETDMTITVDGNSGPFLVNDVPSIVSEGQNVTLTWDVAGTDQAPVNCSNVDVFMSTDGGLTYPITLLSNVANDGSEVFVVPTGLTTTARVMVKCSDNIFFDINNLDFEVEVAVDGFTMELDPASGEVCNDGTIQFNVNTSQIGNYNTDISLNLTGLPAGASSSFSVNPISPGNSSVVTLNNFGSNVGSFTLDVLGSSGGNVRTENYTLELYAPTAAPVLLSPANNAMNVATNPTLTWNSAANATSYEYMVSTSSGGVGIVSQGSTAATSVIINGLNPLVTYFWRVRSINDCGNSAYSVEFSFTTANETEICQTFSSTDTPLTITDATPGQSSQSNSFITVSGIPGNITDVNILNLQGTHTWVEDLLIAMFSPNGNFTQVNLFSQICGNDDDFNLNFDDDAPSSTIACPPTGGLTYQPLTPLSTWNDQDPNGVWQLAILELGVGDEGILTNWEIQVCYEGVPPECDLTVDSDAQSGLGSLLNAIECAENNDVIILESSIPNQTINLGSMNIVLDKNLTIQANPADDITVSYTGNDSAIEIGVGVSVNLIGFTLEHSSTSNEAINCLGTLTTTNLNVVQN